MPETPPDPPSSGRDRSKRPPVSRRRFLAGSTAVGASVAAGCADGGAGSGGDDSRTPTATDEPTVFVFNTGDRTVSLVDPGTDELVDTYHLGVTSSFPANQYAPRVVDDPGDAVWANVGRGVRALGAGALEERARVETGSGVNWQELTPDGRRLVVSAREPAHTQFEVDADPSSDGFGDVLATIDRSDEGGRGDREGPGPCDVTVHPDGRYAYVPDLFGDALTVLDVERFEVVERVPVDPVAGDAAEPWMATADWAGERMLVEHSEGATGTESVWDLSDPASPEELVRLTAEDGLGERPLTSEVTADGTRGFVFTPGTGDVTVVDLESQSLSGRIDLGGAAFTGTWGPSREKLYVPVQTANAVKVIDPESESVTATVEVGAKPYGATAARVRPVPERSTTVAAALDALGAGDDDGTSYCVGNCACGHEL
ncbi:MAG: hypothetical protein ABEJ40_07480 [Haloarculaceae archaeon]